MAASFREPIDECIESAVADESYFHVRRCLWISDHSYDAFFIIFSSICIALSAAHFKS